MFGEIIDLDRRRNVKLAVQNALSRLLERENGDAFVIFQDKETRKFVQFASAEGGNLFLDLPFQALESLEIERAIAFFKRLSESMKQNPIGRAAPHEKARSFQMNFGRDLANAASVVLAIFDLVYKLPSDFILDIEEN